MGRRRDGNPPQKKLTPAEEEKRRFNLRLNGVTIALAVAVVVFFALGLTAWLHQRHENNELEDIDRELQAELNRLNNNNTILTQAVMKDGKSIRLLKYRVSLLKQKELSMASQAGVKIKPHHMDYYVQACVLHNIPSDNDTCENYWQRLEKSCDKHHINCNTSIVDRCEVRHRSDPLNCGSCGNKCPSGTVCKAGSCTTLPGLLGAVGDVVSTPTICGPGFQPGLSCSSTANPCCSISTDNQIDCSTSYNGQCACSFGYTYTDGYGCQPANCPGYQGNFIGCGSSCCNANQADTIYCDQDTFQCVCPSGFVYAEPYGGCVSSDEYIPCGDTWCIASLDQTCSLNGVCQCRSVANECFADSTPVEPSTNCTNVFAQPCGYGGSDCCISTGPNFGCNDNKCSCNQGYTMCSATNLCVKSSSLQLAVFNSPCLDGCCSPAGGSLVCDPTTSTCQCEEGAVYCPDSGKCEDSSVATLCGGACCRGVNNQTCNLQTQSCECSQGYSNCSEYGGCVSSTQNAFSCGDACCDVASGQTCNSTLQCQCDGDGLVACGSMGCLPGDKYYACGDTCCRSGSQCREETSECYCDYYSQSGPDYCPGVGCTDLSSDNNNCRTCGCSCGDDYCAGPGAPCGVDECGGWCSQTVC